MAVSVSWNDQSMTAHWNKRLSKQATLLFILAANVFYILPLLLANAPSAEDDRISSNAQGQWAEQGYPLATLAYRALTFTTGAPELFPLPLLIATALISWAMFKWVRDCFATPTVIDCLVVLPLWYNPFLLQSLSSHYDGPIIALGIALIVFAIVYDSPAMIRKLAIPGLMIACALASSTTSLNVFLGLCCVECMRALIQQRIPGFIGRLLMIRLTQLLCGLCLYVTVGAYDLLTMDSHWLAEIIRRLALLHQNVGFLFNTGTTWLAIALLLVALPGYVSQVLSAFRRPNGVARKAVAVLFYLSLPVALLLLIPGTALLANDFAGRAGTLTGFSTLLIALFFLINTHAWKQHDAVRLVLILPVVCMLSFSYAYARVLILQKELGTYVLFSLAYDIDTLPDLQNIDTFHFDSQPLQNWLPAASGTFEKLPAIKYIMNVDERATPARLQRVGITRGEWLTSPCTAQDLTSSAPIVDRTFYSIKVHQQTGCIVMKKITTPDTYIWEP
ncbi:putative Membrane protein [Pseudomonas viridiflava]|uniref:Putative Membrane protein n=3 Tax=Pseudomonas TaxID=286 RepID=A0A3M4NVH1_PSEVI|nr:putative Membrane protein [Pseudomonas syringae pv. persicae]RMQ13298.1 putative Membrane protein [Pseudomonas viridiflava]RMQ69919.1 putative Membrane protein [Pseudomonas viridiflava]